MTEQMVAGRLADLAVGSAETSSAAGRARLRTAASAHFQGVWCFLRRLGLSPADADDAAQDVMMVVAQRMDSIVPGCERSFMFGTAYRVAAKVRQARRRQAGGGDEDLAAEVDPGPDPEMLSDRKRARDMLDQVLEGLPLELRAVFVLAEIDELPAPQIATLLELPVGTVASRLRRARELFDTRLSQMMARQRFAGGAP